MIAREVGHLGVPKLLECNGIFDEALKPLGS